MDYKVLAELLFPNVTETPESLEEKYPLRDLPEGAEASVEDCEYFGYYNFSKEKLAGYSKLSGTEYYYECQFSNGMDAKLMKLALRGSAHQK